MLSRGEHLSKIMHEKGFTVMSLSKATGVAYTTIRSMIERNLANASIDNVIKICDALHITTETLYHSGLTVKEEKDIAADLERMIGDLESNEALAFHGEAMDEETKELMRISLENSLRLAKQMAKQKFNPNKNK
ncbi:helix-turn-helix transcriptional regulator [Paenibacillus sp. HB172176]|uniref:helix-turn-helix domain-containing protein n=1 Tax=Paenibacillus sp. HB172176 TaxID=2493690 RepID=UPI00197FA5C1|nr:helix-turn-helix transcriptional regulator [Paenibacillus sp. HB172176]